MGIVALPGLVGVQLLLQFPLDEVHEPVLVTRHRHRIQELAEELRGRAQAGLAQLLALGDDGPANLRTLAQEVHHVRVARPDARARVFQRGLLPREQHRRHRRHVDFPPAVGHGLIAALHIGHRRAAFLRLAHLQVLRHIPGRLRVGQFARQVRRRLRPCEDGPYLILRGHGLVDVGQLAVDVPSDDVQLAQEVGRHPVMRMDGTHVAVEDVAAA